MGNPAALGGKALWGITSETDVEEDVSGSWLRTTRGRGADTYDSVSYESCLSIASGNRTREELACASGDWAYMSRPGERLSKLCIRGNACAEMASWGGVEEGVSWTWFRTTRGGEYRV